MEFEDKLYVNALKGESLYKLAPKEKQRIVLQLCKNKSERAVAELTGVPRTTIHDWKTGRQNNKGKDIHVSLSAICRKLRNLDPKDITDWGRIEIIKEECSKLLLRRDNV